MTIKELRIDFTSMLQNIYAKTEIDSFFYILMEEFLALKRVDIALNFNENIKIPKNLLNAFEALKNEEPIQYILGKTSFYGLEFEVTSNVLIPRPETEELVDWIISDMDSNAKKTILDIGTGSGCISVSLAKNLVKANVSALDVSSLALEIAKKNAIKNNVTINFTKQNILTYKSENTWDIIVSNPPYVRNSEKSQMDNNVLDNEPHLALFVENDKPLIFYNAIANFAINNLAKNGLLYFEINQYLGTETKELLSHKGFKNIEIRKDIFNNDRMIKATL